MDVTLRSVMAGKDGHEVIPLVSHTLSRFHSGLSVEKPQAENIFIGVNQPLSSTHILPPLLYTGTTLSTLL